MELLIESSFKANRKSNLDIIRSGNIGNNLLSGSTMSSASKFRNLLTIIKPKGLNITIAWTTILANLLLKNRSKKVAFNGKKKRIVDNKHNRSS
jgi:hypothetical protein